MITCTRRIQFCAGHRVLNHESKCAHLHGHNYVGYFHARAPELDEIGRVIDFSVLKEEIGGWIDHCWDHGFIVFEQDAATRLALRNFSHSNGQQKVYILPVNPTAENLAEYLLREVCPDVLVGKGVEVYKVVLWETENCWASAEL